MFRITTTAAILGMSALFAQPVLADNHADMTCDDYMAMNEADRGLALDGLIAGRDAARAEARGDDGGSTDTNMADETVAAQDLDGGREAARDKARGDANTIVMDGCKDDGSKKVKDIMDNPSNR